MEALPHHYQASASATAEGNVALDSPGVPGLVSAPPAEFGGPGDQWSPETLLMAAVADCFILTFRAVAAASRLEWQDLQCSAHGTLDRVERTTSFTEVTVKAELTIPAGGDEAKAQRLLEKAEHACLITNSMNGETHLEATVKSTAG